jgi:hypothetical protein
MSATSLAGAPAKAGTKLRWVFRGPDGLRAGWSLLIFALVLCALLVAASLAVRLAFHQAFDLKGVISPRVFLISEGSLVILVLAATAIMGWIEGNPVWAYGLGGRRPAQNFLAGLAGGLVCLSVLVGALAAGGYLVFDGAALHGMHIVRYALIWLLAFLLVACGEEAMFRGYLQSTLARGMGFWPAALVSSLVFGAAHMANPGESPAGITGVIAAGLTFCLLLRLSGSLWLGIGFHTTWDWAQSYLYGTPDSGIMFKGHLMLSHAAGNATMSGGSAGPEGSLLGLPVMILGLLALVGVLWRSGLWHLPATTPNTQ